MNSNFTKRGFSKGFYTGTIALTAVIIISVVSFSAISSIEAGEAKSQARAILDVRYDFQKASVIVSKTVSDALADASFDGTSCGYEKNAAGTNLQNYFENNHVLATTYENCTAEIKQLRQENRQVEVEIYCTKNAEGVLAEYKTRVEYNKAVSAVDSGTDCTVTVTDDDTGQVEVQETETYV